MFYLKSTRVTMLALRRISNVNQITRRAASNLVINWPQFTYSNHKSDTFAIRHIGPREHEVKDMVQTLGYKVHVST